MLVNVNPAQGAGVKSAITSPLNYIHRGRGGEKKSRRGILHGKELARVYDTLLAPHNFL